MKEPKDTSNSEGSIESASVANLIRLDASTNFDPEISAALSNSD